MGRQSISLNLSLNLIDLTSLHIIHCNYFSMKICIQIQDTITFNYHIASNYYLLIFYNLFIRTKSYIFIAIYFE